MLTGVLHPNEILHQSFMSSEKAILSCAEHADWKGVLGLLEKDTSLARAADEFNMLPLHWACTEPSIPVETLDKVITAFPRACELPNFSGMLPLHVAIKNNLLGVHIKSIVKPFPDATVLPDGNGKDAVELAMENSLPSFTTEWIRKTASGIGKNLSASSYDLKRIKKKDNQTGHSFDCSTRSIIPMLINSGSSRSFNQAVPSDSICSYSYQNGDEYPDTDHSASTNSVNVCRQLGDLITQLQLLGTEIRSSASSSSSTYRSSSSALSQNATLTQDRMDVLWNPSDKLGIVFEPLNGNFGARISKISSKSTALGVEALHNGNVLLRINDIVVTKAAHSSILRFLKHVRVACTLTFVSSTSSTTSSSVALSHSVTRRSTYQGAKVMSASKEDSIITQSHRLSIDSECETRDIYLRVTELLDRTLRQVSSVEANVRLSMRAP